MNSISRVTLPTQEHLNTDAAKKKKSCRALFQSHAASRTMCSAQTQLRKS